MANIEKAIEKEKEYLSFRIKGEEPFHLVDAVKECGFESLAEYFEAKKKHDFESISFEVINASSPKSSVESIFKVITEKKNAVIFVDINSTMVWTQINSGCNVSYCIEHNIPIVPVGATGTGTLVSTPNDLGIGICIHKDSRFNLSFIVDGFVKIFRKYTDKEIVNQGNDIMYEGKKICGFTYYDTNNMFMVISPISLSEKAELVTNICTKKQVKAVGYIDFMDRDMLRREVSEWLRVLSV